jgi:nitrile hydratase accessory protein
MRPPSPSRPSHPEPAAASFAEPWQAHAFACAIQLSRNGLFTWTEWVQAFSAEIASHPAQPGEASESAYYRQWLATLERLVCLKAPVGETEIEARAEIWRRAYLNTPHGRPVELRHAFSPPDPSAKHASHEDRVRTPTPVAVIPGLDR